LFLNRSINILSQHAFGYNFCFKWITNNDFESWYVEHLQSLYDAYSGDENRKWGVQNKGLCLVLAWANEIIQQGSGWLADENISKR